jgi:hypothetical protein
MARFPWMIAGASPARLAFPLLWAKFGRGGVSAERCLDFSSACWCMRGRCFLYVSMPISGQNRGELVHRRRGAGDSAGRARGAIYKADASR